MKRDKIPIVPPELIYPMNGIAPLGAGSLGLGPLAFDPLGSYTGITEEVLEEPVQDADDL